MLCKTRAIVLKTVKFSETSLVVKLYTEQFGLKSFLVRGVRKKHARNSPNLFQPLSLIEVVFINKPGEGLIIPKENQFVASFPINSFRCNQKFNSAIFE